MTRESITYEIRLSAEITRMTERSDPSEVDIDRESLDVLSITQHYSASRIRAINLKFPPDLDLAAEDLASKCANAILSDMALQEAEERS